MSKLKSGILLLIVASSIMFIFYHTVLLNPNAYLFSDSGDGIKNYYTYYYHIVHDTSFINFEGMNYPYGEHFLYTDCHPVFANLFKLFNGSGFFTQHAIGILNLIMLFSIFLTFFLVYLILLEFKINEWFAVLFSTGITLLAPQLFRMTGHLALSYSMAIPLTWLLMVKYVNTNKKTLTLLGLTLNNIFWLFIHSYLGMILLSFQFVYFITVLFSYKHYQKSVLTYLNIFSTVCLPILLFYVFLMTTDTHLGRTDNPSGFFLYNAEFDDIFIPHHPPLRPLLDRILGPVINLKWEAWSYIGFSNTLIFLFLLIISLIGIFNQKKRALLSDFFPNRILNISLFSAFIVLLFAMAFPFKMFPHLLETFPVLKQFRATGRFAWVFYFAATIFGTFVFQLVYNRHSLKGKQLLGYTLVFVAGFALVIEAIPYHTNVSKSISHSSNVFNDQFLTSPYRETVEAIDHNKYQAIMPLPFYYQGSEKFARPRHEETMKVSMILSAHTGLPMFSTNLTRTAIPESKNIVQLISPSFYNKLIHDDLSNNKAVLIVTTRDHITNYEKKILEKSTEIYRSESINLYSLSIDNLFKNTAESYFTLFEEQKEKLFKKGGFLISDTSSFFYFNPFDENDSDITFRGKGAYSSSKKGKNTLAEFYPGTFKTGNKYSVSCWMYNDYKDALNLYFQLKVEEFSEVDNSWTNTICFPEQAEVINGNWSLVEMEFTVKSPDSYVYIVTKGKDDAKPPFVADELLIKESTLEMYRINNENNTLFYNNHEIKF